MKSKRRIILILVLVVFLPALFFSVYEIGSLNNNEKIINEIYNRQLNIILSSVNSHSQEYASSMATKINGFFASPNTKENLYKFIKSNPSLKGVFYSRDTSYNNLEVIIPDNNPNALRQRVIIEKTLRKNSKKVTKLVQFLANDNYRKIDAYSSKLSPNITYFVFIADNQKSEKYICGIIVDAQEFVNQILSPKIQAIIDGQFIISVRNEAKNKTIYVSEPNATGKELQVKSLWLLPDYKMGIIYKGKTIKQLVSERNKINLIIIILLDLLLIIGVWFVLRNISAEMKLSQMRVDFIANVSHELRTPLALMSVYTETILLGRIKGEKLTEYHNIIHQETSRLTSIVNKILNFSRIEEKKYQFVFEKININEIIDTVLQRFDFHFKSQNFVIEKKYSNVPLYVNGDRNALLEVFINLVDNTIKYSKEEKCITISTFTDREIIHVVFTDKGIGIPENDQKFVFDKFFRVTEGERQGVRGSGLGLSIVKSIMDTHLANIRLESKTGLGSTFFLDFPVYSELHNKKFK